VGPPTRSPVKLEGAGQWRGFFYKKATQLLDPNPEIFTNGTSRAAEVDESSHLNHDEPRSGSLKMRRFETCPPYYSGQSTNILKTMASTVISRPSFAHGHLEQRETANPQICGYFSGNPGAFPRTGVGSGSIF